MNKSNLLKHNTTILENIRLKLNFTSIYSFRHLRIKGNEIFKQDLGFLIGMNVIAKPVKSVDHFKAGILCQEEMH